MDYKNSEDLYIEFREEISKYPAPIDSIMKRLFGQRKNKRPIIDFLNSIYEDDITYLAELEYLDKESVNSSQEYIGYVSHFADLIIKVKDKYKTFEYEIEFQTLFDKSMAIRMFRYGYERAVKRADYSSSARVIKIKLPEPFLVVLEKGNNIPDEISREIEIPKHRMFTYSSKVLKYWDYDLERLYRENLYILYPLQIFRLRKDMEKVSKSNKTYEEKLANMIRIYDELKILVEKTLIALDKAYDEKKIDVEDYNEMTVIIENLVEYFNSAYGEYGDIREAIIYMVKTFYDPKVEEKGIEKGENRKAIEDATNFLKLGVNEEIVAKGTGLPLEKVIEIKSKMIQ